MLNYKSYCNSNTIVSKSILFEQLPTLSQFAIDPKQKVTYELEFDIDLEGYMQMRSKVNTQVKLKCYRCGKHYTDTISTNSEVLLLTPSQAENFNSNRDYYEVSDERLDVSQWLAEEISLAIPNIAMHTSDCLNQQAELNPTEAQADNYQPFSKLKIENGKLKMKNE